MLGRGPALLLAMALAACSSAPPAPGTASATAGAQPRRVILISLDGAGARTLHDLYREGVLDQGGFERFFRDGRVADALIPVDPTLTSTSHVSLATGFPPAATGIVANQFHPAGSPSTERANGFEAAIGTETLWEAVRRQRRRAGVLAWPGADARGERRTADWGVAYNSAAERGARFFIFSREDWTPPPAANPEGLVSHSPPLTARVTLGGDTEAASYTLDLFAVDGTDDATVNYDSAAVLGRSTSAVGRVTAPLRAGEWEQVVWPGAERPTASWLKLLALKPDLSEARLLVDGVHETIAYPGDLAESLSREGLYWPGAPASFALVATWKGRPGGIDLDTWVEQAEHMAAFMGETLRLAAARPDWDLLMGYIPVLDQAGHWLLLLDPRQDGFSPERRDELTRARHRVWQAVDAELRKLIAELDLTRTTLVVVSDHGMAPVHTAVDPTVPLAALGLLVKKEAAGGGAAPGPTAYAIGDGGVAHIHVEGGDAEARERLLTDLARRYAEWRLEGGEAPVEKVFNRQEAKPLGIDHPNSGDLILFAREGYMFRPLPEGKPSAPALFYGAHGYLSTHPDMQAVYLAIGAGVEPGRGGTVHATEIAPRVAAWLGIAPPRPE